MNWRVARRLRARASRCRSAGLSGGASGAGGPTAASGPTPGCGGCGRSILRAYRNVAPSHSACGATIDLRRRAATTIATTTTASRPNPVHTQISHRPVSLWSDAADPPGAADGVADRLGTSAVSAPTRFTTPYPYSGSRPLGPLSIAVAVNRWMTSAADSFGNRDRTNAAAPATMAVASLVPLPVRYRPPGAIDSMSAAGAASTTSGPVSENGARLPALSTPATATTPGYAAGKWIWVASGALPTDATTTMSCAIASCTACCSS